MRGKTYQKMKTEKKSCMQRLKEERNIGRAREKEKEREREREREKMRLSLRFFPGLQYVKRSLQSNQTNHACHDYNEWQWPHCSGPIVCGTYKHGCNLPQFHYAQLAGVRHSPV